MLSCFSHVQLFATLWTVICQALLSMGFSSKEYWSELPCTPPGDLLNPGIELRSPELQADSLLSESPRKPKNSGMGSLSLLWGILLTHESNRGLLHCRQILNQLSYQGTLYGLLQCFQSFNHTVSSALYAQSTNKETGTGPRFLAHGYRGSQLRLSNSWFCPSFSLT